MNEHVQSVDHREEGQPSLSYLCKWPKQYYAKVTLHRCEVKRCLETGASH